jgi:hypothetical protein
MMVLKTDAQFNTAISDEVRALRCPFIKLITVKTEGQTDSDDSDPERTIQSLSIPE